jgi:hypothetical protein
MIVMMFLEYSNQRAQHLAEHMSFYPLLAGVILRRNPNVHEPMWKVLVMQLSYCPVVRINVVIMLPDSIPHVLNVPQGG